MTATIPPQPVLPAEQRLTDAEVNFMQEEPPRFFPENQNSNWGLKRKLFSDQTQALINQLDEIYAERWPMTSSIFLDEWEKMVGLPQNPSGRTIGQRRNSILTRLKGGPWTRSMRKQIVEGYLSVLAFGDPIALLPPGVGFDSSGLPLYDEPGTVSAMYRIYEDVERYRYKVKIDSGHSPDTVSMQRDLIHSQYAGLTLIIDTSTPTCYDYTWDTYTIDTAGAFWPLTETLGTSAVDFTTHAQNGTYTGVYTLNNTALLVNDGTLKSVVLAGGYISVPDSNYLDCGDTVSVEAWIKRVTVDGTDQYLVSKGTGAYGVRLRTDNRIVLSKVGTGDIAASTGTLTDTASSHYVVVQKSGTTVEIWLDGVNVTGAITNQTLTDNAVALNIGREVSGATANYKGVIGYVTLNKRLLTSAEITRRYNTGRDINR